MKKLIRKLNIIKKHTRGENKYYLIVYKDDYDIIIEEKLKEILLKPKKEIKFIFNWEDRLDIDTKFEEENQC